MDTLGNDKYTLWKTVFGEKRPSVEEFLEKMDDLTIKIQIKKQETELIPSVSCFIISLIPNYAFRIPNYFITPF